jgi:hypothetical protein
MNQILILEPRWHDNVVLVADYRIFEHNEVVIRHGDFPEPFYLTGERAREFPLEKLKTKAGGEIDVRAIPIDELAKEVVNAG